MKNVSETLITAESINLIHSSIETRNKLPLVGQALFTLAQESSDQLTILTPYVIGDKIIIDALKDLNKSKQIVLLNNPLTSALNYSAFSNYLRHQKDFTYKYYNL